jgi:hypothetical protein
LEALASILRQPIAWEILDIKQRQNLLKVVLQVGERCKIDSTVHDNACAMTLSIIEIDEIFEYVVSLPNYVTEMLKQSVTLLHSVDSLQTRWKLLKVLAKFVLHPDWKPQHLTIDWSLILDKSCQSPQQLQYLSDIVSACYQSYIMFFELVNPRTLDLPRVENVQ